MSGETLLARVRRLAREQKLAGVDFLDEHGRVGARGPKVAHIELQFSSGERVKLTPFEMAALKDVHFDLQRMAPEPLPGQRIEEPVILKDARAQVVPSLDSLGGCPFEDRKDITCTYPECGCHEEDEGC